MKLEQIEYVAKIEEYHSINQAAKSMYFTQPFLSSNIKSLEEELGFKIFNRSTHGVTLTDEGKKFLEYGNQILELVKKIGEIGNESISKTESLSVCYLPSYHVLDLLHKFVHKSGNKIEFNVFELENAEIYHKVKDNPECIGIAFHYGEKFDNWTDFCEKNNLQFIELYKEPINIVVGKNCPLFKKDVVRYADLDGYEAITDKIRLGQDSYQYTMADFLQKHFVMSHIAFDNNRSKLYFLSKSSKNFGLSVEWFETGNPLILNKEIKFIPIEDAETKRSLGVVINKNRKLSSIENKFIEYIKTLFDGYTN